MCAVPISPFKARRGTHPAVVAERRQAEIEFRRAARTCSPPGKRSRRCSRLPEDQVTTDGDLDPGSEQGSWHAAVGCGGDSEQTRPTIPSSSDWQRGDLPSSPPKRRKRRRRSRLCCHRLACQQTLPRLPGQARSSHRSGLMRQSIDQRRARVSESHIFLPPHTATQPAYPCQTAERRLCSGSCSRRRAARV